MKWLVFTLHDDDCSLLPTSSKSQRIWNSCGIAGTPGYLEEIGYPWAQTDSQQPRTVNAISAPTAVHGMHSHSSIGITWSNKWKERWGREQATSEPKPEKLKLWKLGAAPGCGGLHIMVATQSKSDVFRNSYRPALSALGCGPDSIFPWCTPRDWIVKLSCAE